MWRLLLILTVISRITSPFFVFIHPGITAIIVYCLDSIDGFLAFKSKFAWTQYNTMDKLLDYWWYVFILIFMIGNELFPIVMILFIYRSIGQILCIVTKRDSLLLLFPNIHEHFFWLYLFSLYTGLSIYFKYGNVIIPLLIATIIAVSKEYVLHIKKSYMANYLFHMKINWNKNNHD